MVESLIFCDKHLPQIPSVALALRLPPVSPWPGWTDRLGTSEQVLGIIVMFEIWIVFFGSAPCLNMRSYDYIISYISNMIFCCMWPLLKVSRFEVIEIGWWQIWIPHRCCLRCPALQNSSMIGTGFRQCQGDHWITHGSPWITIDSEQHWFPLNPDVLIPCKSLFCISKKSR